MVLSKRGWALENVVERLHARFGFGSARRCGWSDTRSHRDWSPSTVVPSLQLTPHWCVLSTKTAHLWRAAQHDGVVLQSARRRKERTSPELLGWWSEETRMLLSLLARTKARCENPLLRKRISKLGVSGGVHSCPASLLAQSPHQCWSCLEHVAPQHDVEQDFCFTVLVG